MQVKLLVIILNYRVTDLTIDCLHSLVPEIPRVPGIKVAVCENGTGGDAAERLAREIADNGWQPWVELTAVTPNRGFTGGNNIIIRKWLESGDCLPYFLLLNADTLVKPGAIELLVQFMDNNPEVGIAGSQLELPNGLRQGSPFRFQSIASELDRGLGLGIVSRLLSRWSSCAPMPLVPSPVDWVSGACMIIRREVIDTIGPLDEGFYTYYDDIDFCLNAKRAGWVTWCVPDSRVIHIAGQSTGIKTLKRRPEYWFQARRRFFLKNYGAFYTLLVDAAFLLGFALWRVRQVIQGKPDTAPPHLLLDSLRHSVFLTGFAVRDVENPAFRQTDTLTSAKSK